MAIAWHLQEAIGGMEATRQRKDREFQRLQRNLMELLSEQKEALDQLREKGVELETATATSAAAVDIMRTGSSTLRNTVLL